MENEEPKKPRRIILIGSVGGNVAASAALIHSLREKHKSEIIVVETSKEARDFLIKEKEVVIPIRNLICEMPVSDYDPSLYKKNEERMLKQQNKLRQKHFDKNSAKMFRKKK